METGGGGVLVLVKPVRKACFFPVISHSQCMNVLNIYDGMIYMEKPSWKEGRLVIVSCSGLFFWSPIFIVVFFLCVHECATIREIITNNACERSLINKKRELKLIYGPKTYVSGLYPVTWKHLHTLQLKMSQDG